MATIPKKFRIVMTFKAFSSMENVWRAAFVKALTTMLPVFLFAGLALAPLYIIGAFYSQSPELLQKQHLGSNNVPHHN